ncbi:hypothetical protein FQN54_002656 [Arachnomyces sp. PD_36]|nr:hypothetical protein FQN54_002656 [Arachnomyces sp. PD_36]
MATSTSTLEEFQIISTLRYDPDLAIAATNAPADSYPPPQNSPYYLLSYHHARLLSAAKHFQWDRAIDALQNLSVVGRDLEPLSQTLDSHIPDKSKPWRIRVALSRDGSIAVTTGPTLPFSSYILLLPPPSQTHLPSFSTLPEPDGGGGAIWRLYLDTQPITPSGFTTHKTTARDVYKEANERVGINSPEELAEVLVYNPLGEVMEGSKTTPYFRRRKTSTSSGGEEDGVEWVTPPLSSGGNDGTTRRYALSRGFCVQEVIRMTDIVEGEVCWLSNGVRGFMKAVVVPSS